MPPESSALASLSGTSPEGNRLSSGVAMCTCNGGRFLIPQLESIVAQTQKPEHIVISDDLSTDDTWTKLQDWASAVRAVHGIRVTLIQNAVRLGVTKNFEQAIRALDTDIVFLADQDDVWLPNKIEVLVACFTDSATMLAHSDAILIDENGKDLGKSLFEALRLSDREKELVKGKHFFEIYCRRNLVTGTTAAFRRKLLGIALPFPEDWIHDEWLAACAAAESQVAMLTDKLTQYRQHGTNAIGVPVTSVSRLALYAKRVARTPRDEHLRYKLRRLDALRERLVDGNALDDDKLALLDEARAHFERRIRFGHSPTSRVTSILREYKARGYHRFADGFAGMVRDVIHL